MYNTVPPEYIATLIVVATTNPVKYAIYLQTDADKSQQPSIIRHAIKTQTIACVIGRE